MKLTLEARTLRLRLVRPFGISGLRRERVTTVLARAFRGRFEGFGESVEHPLFGVAAEGLEEEIAALSAWLPEVDFLPDLSEALMLAPFSPQARSAVDQALWDLHGREEGKPTRELFSRFRSALVPLSSITIGLDTPERMAEDVAFRSGWPIFKVKLGGPNDEVCLRTVRELAPEKRIRVDANGGWSGKTATRMLRLCEELAVELIEQPFPPHDHVQTATFRASSSIPVFADESCRNVEEVADCEGVFDGVNVKLYKCGGLLPARKMMEEARARGLKIMLGCMLESVVGVSAAAQIADRADFLDLDGVKLLGEQPCRGVELENGRLRLSDEPGNGLRNF